MREGLPWRVRLAAALRVLTASALVVLAAAFFYQPFSHVLAPRVLPTAYRLGLPTLFRPAPARGFFLQIATDPPGATVLIDGQARGTTPAILNVVCTDGQEVTVTLRKAGFPEFRQAVPCREGERALARIRLGE